jgi:methylthioribose-1-phosphate isomerase
LCLALRAGEPIEAAYEQLVSTRPTAINLRWALDEVRAAVASLPYTLPLGLHGNFVMT